MARRASSKVTRHHRTRDYLIHHVPFPISAPFYLQPFSTYCVTDISESYRPFRVTWRHRSCDHLIRHMSCNFLLVVHLNRAYICNRFRDRPIRDQHNVNEHTSERTNKHDGSQYLLAVVIKQRNVKTRKTIRGGATGMATTAMATALLGLLWP